MLTLYDYLPSQNAYKVRLLLSHLGRPYRTEIVSIFEGRGQDPEYLRINPTGAVPAIRTEDGKVLAESLAILTFLAEGSRYLPQDPYQRARALQNSIEHRAREAPGASVELARVIGTQDPGSSVTRVELGPVREAR